MFLCSRHDHYNLPGQGLWCSLDDDADDKTMPLSSPLRLAARTIAFIRTVIAERRAAARRVNGIDTQPNRPRHPMRVFVTVETATAHGHAPTGGSHFIPHPRCLIIISSPGGVEYGATSTRKHNRPF